ncbi:MAG: flavin reductase family protein [Gammaproteobacteria bacterium]|nr:flavin reductase family protein [Gammaproteobacteria bacterium]
MPKRSLNLAKAYTLLEPGPVVLITTAHKDRSNIMTLSWHCMMEFEPPLVGFVMSAGNDSFELLKASRECVINIPTVDIAKQVVSVGNSHGSKVDKFAAFGLTAKPAAQVKAPLIGECYANLECKVVDTRLVNQYNFFILEVVKGWIDTSVKKPRTLHHRGNGVFMVAGEVLKLPSRMK